MPNRRRNPRELVEDPDAIESLYWEGGRAKDGRPVASIFANEVGRTLDDVDDAMLDQGTPLFQQNGRLVHLVRYNRDGALGAHEPRRSEGGLVILEASPHLVTELAMSAAVWTRKDMRKDSSIPDPDDPTKMKKGVWVVSPFTVELARHYMSRGQWKLRVLKGAVESPTLRRDGTLLEAPGYDANSQLFLDLGGVEFPPVPALPGREEAEEALGLLIDPIKDFPCEPDDGEPWGGLSAARSVALSAMLTGLVRASLGTAPAHVFDAPVMGSGKTKLAEIASVVATGRTPTAISYGSSQEEFQKRLFSVLYKGDKVGIIDNIEQQVESDEFCTILTSEEWQSRVLGHSKMATVPTNTLWLLTGNRVTFKGDITDRVIVCNLDPRMEDPKTRLFDREPVSFAMEHRPELVRAGLTILYAHALAGFPGASGLTPSRFPDWDRMVRGALVWLGEPDPQVTRQRVATVDPVREVLSSVMNGWEDTIGFDVPVTAKQLIAQSEVIADHEAPDFKWQGWGQLWPIEEAEALHESLQAATTPKKLDARNLGTALSKFVGRVHQGRVIRSRPDPKSATTFWLAHG